MGVGGFLSFSLTLKYFFYWLYISSFYIKFVMLVAISCYFIVIFFVLWYRNFLYCFMSCFCIKTKSFRFLETLIAKFYLAAVLLGVVSRASSFELSRECSQLLLRVKQMYKDHFIWSNIHWYNDFGVARDMAHINLISLAIYLLAL